MQCPVLYFSNSTQCPYIQKVLYSIRHPNVYNLFQPNLEKAQKKGEGTPIFSPVPIEIFDPKYSKQNTSKIREYFHVQLVLLKRVILGI